MAGFLTVLCAAMKLPRHRCTSLLIAGIREARRTYLALIPVVGGIVIATFNEPSFHLLGFLACISATAGRALKSVVQVCVLCLVVCNW